MGNKSIFLYEVLCHEMPSDTFYLTSGMGFATDFGDAAKLLEDIYDEDLKAIKNIEFCYLDNEIITLPRKVLRKYKNEEYEDRIPCDENGRELTTSINCGCMPDPDSSNR